ncbi:hypothetical protein [Pelagicoccus albus]|uniref:Lipoprotein n=1 Tax=Pelagicoccus albus TaxID=415222 RepID=A0A7X1EA11_9BACT|nr:hypothetical protein [Pelagicoccus albus]MBC2607773.1 hypothetical protein [Pelagicoccus albus]
MKVALPLLLLSALFLSACGAGPEPDRLEGEEQATKVVYAFLTALQSGDEEKALALIHNKPDYIIKDFERCREYFFDRQPTGRKMLEVGRETYGAEWQIYLDLQLNYGPQMKQLHFILGPGNPPTVRGVTPIVPDDQTEPGPFSSN